jgi:CheY-like chemotaxis protein
VEVLIADDEPSVRSVLGRMVDRLGHRALTAGDGKVLVETFQRAAPAVVLCDVNFGTEDGIALCLALKARGTRAAFAIMTGDADSVSRAESAGFETVLLKPITWIRLGEVLSAFARRAGEPPGA